MTSPDVAKEGPATAAGPAGVAPAPAPAARGVRAEMLYFAIRNGKLVAGLSLLSLLLVVAIAGPLLMPGDPNAYVGLAGPAPSAEYWFGTTHFGQDIFMQFVYGLQSTFMVGALGGGLAAIIGMVIGFTAGYWGGIVDEILNALTNVVLVLPTLAVLLVVNAYLGVRSVAVQALFIGLTSWPWAARAIRAQTFSLRARDFTDLARLSGVRTWKIITREIAPNMSSYLFMTFILLFGGAILIGASLDFIGLGPTQGISLGLMLNNAARWSALHLGMWWWFVPPGAGITAIVGSLYVMNVGLDEVFNPKLRET